MHGRPVLGTVMRLPMAPQGHAVRKDIFALMHKGAFPPAARDRLDQLGLRWLVIYTRIRPLHPATKSNLIEHLGTPVQSSEMAWVFRLDSTVRTPSDN